MTDHRSLVTTHVLDASLGRPAADVEVSLETGDGTPVATARTDADGRVAQLGPETLEPGHHRLRFATGAYFTATGVPAFFPEVTVDFVVDELTAHYHVPLLLSPFAYSTYRGS